MHRIVLDSNVIARAVMSPYGPASALFTLLVNSKHEICTSDYLLAEVFRILSYPRLKLRHQLSDKEIEDFIQSLQGVSLVVKVGQDVLPHVSRDVNDDAVVRTAVLASATYLCSCDKDILDKTVVDYCKSYKIEVLGDISLLKLIRSI